MKNIISAIVLSACAAAYGVDIKSGGNYVGTHYFYNESETVEKSIDGSVEGYPQPDWVKINYSKSESPISIVVKNGVNVSATNTILIYGSKTSISFEGNNSIKASSFSLGYGSSLYAKDAIFNVSSFDLAGSGSNKAVIVGGTFNAGRLNVGENSSIVFDGTTGKIDSVCKRGAVSGGEEFSFDMTLKNGASMEITPAYLGAMCSNLYIESGSSLTIGSKLNTGTDVVVGAGSSITVNGTLRTTKTLTVASDASVSAGDVSFEKLTITFEEDFQENTDINIDLASIFGSNATIVASALESGKEFTITGNDGKEYNASYSSDSGSGLIHIGPQVPEPSTYAMVLGMIAMALAAYRRSKK